MNKNKSLYLIDKLHHWDMDCYYKD